MSLVTREPALGFPTVQVAINSTSSSWTSLLNEPCHEKPCFFAYANKKVLISCSVTAKLISAFVFATQIVQSLCFLNPKFPASSNLLWLHSLVMSDLVGNPDDRFFCDAAQILKYLDSNIIKMLRGLC